MNKKIAKLNIIFGIISRVLVLLFGLLAKRYLVITLGKEANGLFSLYVSILGILSIANLGIGQAITFSMYKPIIEKDNEQVSALFYLYRRFYRYVFLAIVIIGLLLTPFLPVLAKNNTGEFNIYSSYIIFLFSVMLTYLYAHKISLINAFKENYKTTIAHAVSLTLEGIIQIAILMITKSFELFLLVRVVSVGIEYIITEYIFRKKYKNIITNNKDIDPEIKEEVIINTKALVYHRIGGTLIGTFDSLIISAFVGIQDLGTFSNYVLIVTSMSSILSMVFTEITSIIGHQYVEGSKEQYYNQFKRIYIINFIMGVVFFLGYYAISHHLVELIFTSDNIITNDIVVVITISYFVVFIRNSVSLFKNASGLFHYDRFRPLIEGIVNIILSIIFVKFWGVKGVLIATIITRLSLSYIIDIFILFKHRFERNMIEFYPIHYGTFISMLLLIFIFNKINFFKLNNFILDLIVKGSIAVGISSLFLLILYIVSKRFRKVLKDILNEFKFKKRRNAK